MSGPSKYKVNARQIGVLDAGNNFSGTNVETVLTEVATDLGVLYQGGFVYVVSEIPCKHFDFFQDPDLYIFRSSEEIEVLYNNNDSNLRIEHIHGTTSETQTTTFSILEAIKAPCINTVISFPNSEGYFDFIYNKNGTNYYKVRAEWNKGLVLSKVIDGVETTLYTYDPVLFSDNTAEYTISLRKPSISSDFRVNNVRYMIYSDTSLDNVGSVEIQSSTSTPGAKLYLNYIIIGHLAQFV